MLLFDSDTMGDSDYATEALESKAIEIIETLKEGNNWKVGNSVLFGTSALGLVAAGGGVVSPFVGLMLAAGGVSSLVSYITYCLKESEVLEVNPMWIPLIGGEEETTLGDILTERQQCHWNLIQGLGIKKVKVLEQSGYLEDAIEALAGVDVSELPLEKQDSARKAATRQVLAAFNMAGRRAIDEYSDIPKTPAISPRTVSAGINEAPFDGGYLESKSTPAATDYRGYNPEDDLPEVYDIAFDIADSKKHILIVASTTSGKSTLLSEVLRYSNQMEHHITILDGKGNRAFASSGAIYRQCNTPERALMAIKELRILATTLKTRIDVHMATGQTDFTPITILVDEINVIRSLLDKNSLKEFTDLFKLLLLQGASSKMFIRASSHTSRLAQLGLDGGEADSLGLVSLGRDGCYESIEDMIRYNVTDRERQSVNDSLGRICRGENFRETLCLSHLKKRGFLRSPWLEKLPQQSEASIVRDRDTLEKSLSISGYGEEGTVPPQSGIQIQELVQMEERVNSSKVDALTDVELDVVMTKMIDFVKGKQKIVPSDVTNGCRAFRSYSADDVYRLFQYLVGEGYGILKGREFYPHEG